MTPKIITSTDSIRPVVKPVSDPFKPFLSELTARHEARTANDPDFVFTRERLALTQRLMKDTSVPLQEAERRQLQLSIEQQQLALENTRRKAKGEELLKEIKNEEDEDAPAEPDKSTPEDDAYLAETGKILIDYLGLSNSLAKH